MTKISSPLVSVLMTAYNREQYIATAIESVLVQSMEDFELIIVDDCSTDRSVEIAKSYGIDSRVRVYVNKENLGDYPNRNHAASFATGKYLKYVDSDDAIYPHCLEVMTHMMERHPKAGMLLCAWSENDSFYPFELSPLEAYRRCFLHEERMSNSPLTTMYRRDAFDQLGGFDIKKWPLSCDWDLILRMAGKFNTVFAPTGLAFYRIHADQVSFTERDNYLKHRTPVGTAIAISALSQPDCPLPQKERRYALGRYIRLGLRFAVGLTLKKLRPFAALKFLRDLKIALSEFPFFIGIKKPDVPVPSLGCEPDWVDYPRSRVDRLHFSAEPTPISDGVSLIIAGHGNEAEWEKTIRSALVQSEDQLEVIAVSSPHCSNPPLDLMEKYSFVRLINLREDNIWIARNRAANESRGAHLKFIEPGILLYPYLVEFQAYPLGKIKDANLIFSGDLGHMPFNMVLDPGTAVTCEAKKEWHLISVPISCIMVRKSAFFNENGFNPYWKDWTAYELWFRILMMDISVSGVFGQIHAQLNGERPIEGYETPVELKTHLEILLKNQLGKSQYFDDSIIANNQKAYELRDKAYMSHSWSWEKYSWVLPNAVNYFQTNKHGTE